MAQDKNNNSIQKHLPVMVKEVVEGLNLSEGSLIVDGTLGLGGYSEAVLSSGKKVKVVAFELDQANLEYAKSRLEKYQDNFIVIHDNFANIKEDLAEKGIEQIDGLMLDLGLSSPQVDEAERGFSFSREGELDMRFNKQQSLTAADVINKYSAEHLEKIFREYGEERYSRKIAQSIVKRRSEKTFTTTTELAEFVASLIRGKKEKIHPATRVFQALRIEVNQELQSLERVLTDSVDLLAKSGRLAVVSYHSLEDRIVKNFFRDASREFINLPNELTTRYLQPKLRILNKKPITPSNEEIKQNPRSRSAKLRLAERI